MSPMKSGKSYVTFASDGSYAADAAASAAHGEQAGAAFGEQARTAQGAPSSRASADAASEPTDVAYRLARLVEEVKAGAVSPNAIDAADASSFSAVSKEDVLAAGAEAGKSSPETPRVLVMARGKTAKAVIPAAADAGFSVWVPFTQDRRFEPHLRQADGTVCLGERYSDGLFANAHAVLAAAEEAEASVILLADEALPLARVDGFLSRAAARGLRVLRPVTDGLPILGWVLCTTDKPAPETDLWRTCPHCGLSFGEESVAASHYVCPNCGGYLRMTSNERIADLLDSGSFEEWDAHVDERDPLEFPGYAEKLDSLRQKTGLDEAIRTGRGRIAGIPVALAVMESTFLMGSMGTAVGQKMCNLVHRATAERLPVIAFTASGGARMQEGLESLMQMAKISCALSRHAEAGLPYFSVITDPTTGGVTASFAMQGDVVLSEPRALIGFAGQRVIRDTIKQELPEGFQTAEFALEHGLIDGVVSRSDMRSTLAQLVALHLATAKRGEPIPGEARIMVSYEAVCDNLQNGTDTYNKVTYGLLPAEEEVPASPERFERSGFFERLFGSSKKRLAREADRRRVDADAGRSLAPSASGDFAGATVPTAGSPAAAAERDGAKVMREKAPLSTPAASAPSGANAAWESVQLARNVHRPTAKRYIEHMVKGFIELHGDRAFADDGAIVAGIGWIGGQAVTVVAQEKGSDLKERIRRNFGCPQPEGYRKSLRLMRQAEKFGRPIVCLVDTQGAFCGTEAEERGQGNAIADNLVAMAGLRVPVVSVFLGEGGSGGALALAVANRVAMQEHAVYSVLSPEGFASILWKDRTRAPEAAAVMKMSAREACDMGIVDDVLSEGPAPAHENPEVAAEEVAAYVKRALAELAAVAPDDLVEQRRCRFEAF